MIIWLININPQVSDVAIQIPFSIVYWHIYFCSRSLTESNVRNKLIRIANPNKDDYYKMLSRIVAHNSDNVLNKAIIFEFTYASVEWQKQRSIFCKRNL